MRRVPLWPETVAALKAVLKTRPAPKDAEDKDLVFITKYGAKWVRFQQEHDENGALTKSVLVDSVGLQFGKLLRLLGLKREKVSFYALRHTFETVAGASKDQVATDAVMGHADASMSAAYRERIDDDRLRAVVEHVHAWLWSKNAKTATKTTASKGRKARAK